MSSDKGIHDLCEQVLELAEIVEGLERSANPEGQDAPSAQKVAAAVRAIALTYSNDNGYDGSTFGDEDGDALAALDPERLPPTGC